MSSVTGPSWPAELYDKARPSYPESLIQDVVNSPTSSKHLNIVELGAGTGICTKMLITACSNLATSPEHPTLASCVALDASESMLETLKGSILNPPNGLIPLLKAQGHISNDVKIASEVSRFETFDAAHFGLEGQVDLIVVAQAFHWCPDYEKTLSSFAKALKPGGTFALIWNLEDRESSKWVAAVRDIYEVHEAGTPQYRHMYWHAIYKCPSMELFEVLPPQHLTRAIPTTIDGVCSRALSKSFVSVLSADEMKNVESKIRDVLSRESTEKRWIDKEKGIFEYPYRSDLHIFRKK